MTSPNSKPSFQLGSRADFRNLLRDSGLPRGAVDKLVAGGWPALSGNDDCLDELGTLLSDYATGLDGPSGSGADHRARLRKAMSTMDDKTCLGVEALHQGDALSRVDDAIKDGAPAFFVRFEAGDVLLFIRER